MLNKLVDSELQEIEGKQYDGFKVTDIGQANWCFRKIRALKAKIGDTKALAAQERERIDKWEKIENENAESSINFFEGLLTEYYKDLREIDPKAKVSTPYGKITSRKSTKWNYEDEDILLRYLKENDADLIKIKASIDKEELKKKYKDGINKETGEILPGVQISKEESISIKVD